MEQASIDGRRRNKYSTAAVNQTRKSETESSSLRPASPPRSNPWNSAKKPAASPLNGMFPPLPKLQALRSPIETSTTGVSRTSLLPPELSRSVDDTAPPSTTIGSTSPSSNASSSSRHIFEAAAPRAAENLWKCPFGADVVDGTPVVVHMRGPPETVAHCLRYMYTGTIDICEYDSHRPWKSLQIPRCALAYTVAVYLRMARLASHLLREVENTAVELGTLIQGEYLRQNLDCAQWVQFSWHFENALELILQEKPDQLMMPMKLAMASILDAIIFWVVKQPLFNSELRSSWRRIMQKSLRDIAEYKQLQRNALHTTLLPREAVLRELFEEMKPRTEEEITRSAGTQTENTPVVPGERDDRKHTFPAVRRERRCSL
ncbi:hypothetical protein FHETE_8624 [Fusarium heterosporum]|uniref:BTB domain-containing protein n=1 Tax=Fusarium heterosporum TaxID=42747 RepID=A0A8H5T1P9_FUSHE|nr:hypothetical protein FHETE_8624 [Fusarium heterosporum]